MAYNIFDTIYDALNTSLAIQLGLQHNPQITDSPRRRPEGKIAESTPTFAYLKRITPVDFKHSDIIAECINEELEDNSAHNGVLSANALAWRNKVFRSMFKRPVSSPKKPAVMKRKRTNSDVGYAANEVSESVGGCSVSVMDLDEEERHDGFHFAPGPPPVLCPGNANKHVEKIGPGLIGAKNSSAARKSYHATVINSGIQKRIQKSASKKKSSPIIPLVELDDDIHFSSQRPNKKSYKDFLCGEDDGTENEEFKAEETNDEETTAEEDDRFDEDDEGRLFVKPKHFTPKRATRTMTARRVAMLAKDYMKELYAKATSEPISDGKIALKSALDKVKASHASTLNPVEEIELRLAIQTYEDERDGF